MTEVRDELDDAVEEAVENAEMMSEIEASSLRRDTTSTSCLLASCYWLLACY